MLQRSEGKISISPPTQGRFILSTLFYLVIAAAVSLHCYRAGVLAIDVLGYAGTVALADTGDVVKAHQMVYSARLPAHLLGLDQDTPLAREMRQRAADPYFAALNFPYFAIKPLYVLTLEAIHKAGLSVIDSCRAASGLFYFGIAVLVWAYTRSWLALIVLILPETIILGQTQDPDGMSCFLLLLGLWMVFSRNVDMGVLPLLLAVWVRPENALLSVLVILALVFKGRLDWKKAAVLVVLSVGSELVINHYGYSWDELYGHFLGAEPGTGAASTFSRYGISLLNAVNTTLHGAVPLFGLLWLVCFPIVKEDMRWTMGITLLFSAARFVLFPVYEPRYYGPFFVTTSIAAVLSIRSGLGRDFPGKLVWNLREAVSQLRRSDTKESRVSVLVSRCE